MEELVKRGRLDSLSQEEIAEQLGRFSPEQRRELLRQWNEEAAAQENAEGAAEVGY